MVYFPTSPNSVLHYLAKHWNTGTCASGAWHNRTPAAYTWNSWFDFSRAMAPQQCAPEPRWLQDSWDHAAAYRPMYICMRCRPTMSTNSSSDLLPLERSAAKCCRRCCQRVEKASAGVCLHERRTLRTYAVGCFDNGMKLSIDCSLCKTCFWSFQ